MIHILPLLTLVPVLLTLSNPKAEKETYIDYADETTGWATVYPASWQRMNKEEIAEVEGRGHQAVEKAIDQKLDPSHKNLLWLQKDAFNSFTSNYQLLHDSTLGSYAVIQEVMKELIIQTYLQQGIKHSTTSRKVKIDGNTFNLLEVKLFSPDGKKLIMSQHIYDGLIDPNTMLLINTNFNNAKDKAVLTRIVKSSTFRKRP